MPRTPSPLSTTGLRVPSPWRAVSWALRAGGSAAAGPALGARALVATLRHGKPLRRWMAMVQDLRARGLVEDEQREYLRALRPSVERHTGVAARIAQLIDHMDWLETALQPPAFERLARGKPLVLAELAPPRGCASLRVQLQRPARPSPEGELLVTLTLRRAPEVQPAAADIDIAVLACTRIRLQGTPCLAIGGVRGQRQPGGRVSPVEIGQALHGWKAPVLVVRVAQELARWWGLRLVGLNPSAHRLQGWPYRWRRDHRDAAQKIYASYGALWEHFGATRGPGGWLVLPLEADDQLAATALSPEKRARQVRRADFWIRTRQLLRAGFERELVRQAPERPLGAVTQDLGPRTVAQVLDDGLGDPMPSLAADTGPGGLD